MSFDGAGWKNIDLSNQYWLFSTFHYYELASQLCYTSYFIQYYLIFITVFTAFPNLLSFTLKFDPVLRSNIKITNDWKMVQR